jgi:hypothetical protein
MSETGALEAPAAAGAPAATDPAAPPAAAGQVAPEWRAALPAELRDAPSLASLADVTALAKAHVEAQTMIGRKGLIVPKADDPPAVHAAYRAALGVPEKPEGYAFKAPEGVPPAAWDEGGLKALASWAHELGMTPAQAQGIAERFAKQQGEAIQRAAEGIEPDGRKMEDVLRGEWGVNYDANLERARRAARQFGGDAIADALEAKVGGSAMLRFFAKIGEAVGEDSPAGMGTGSRGADPKAERARYFEAGTPENRAYTNPLDPGHAAAQARVKALFAAEVG